MDRKLNFYCFLCSVLYYKIQEPEVRDFVADCCHMQDTK